MMGTSVATSRRGLVLLVLFALGVVSFWSSSSYFGVGDDIGGYCGIIGDEGGHGDASFLDWLKRQAVRYQHMVCTAHPRKVDNFKDHVPFERNYINHELLGTLPPYDVAKMELNYVDEFGVVFTVRADREQMDMVQRTLDLMEKQNRETVPVEIWFSEDEIPWEHPICDGKKYQYVECRMFYDPKGFGLTSYHFVKSGYAYCVYAIYLSRFRHVLFLDVDAVPMDDITHLFRSKQYEEFGHVFYGDLWGTNTSDAGETAHLDSPLWEFVDVEPYPTKELESGILMIDKQRFWEHVNLVLHMSRHQQMMAKVAPRGYGKIVHGDKDLWRLGFLYLKTKMLIGQPAALGNYDYYAVFFWLFYRKGFGHISLDEPDRVLFVHQPKLMELPRWSGFTHALTDVHCKDKAAAFYSWGYTNYHPCTFKYDYETGKLEKPSSWLVHECQGRKCFSKQVK